MTLPEIIWEHAMHEALMENRMFCTTPRYFWKTPPDPMPRPEHWTKEDFEREYLGSFTGADCTSIARDPEGLDEIHPVIEAMLQSKRLGKATMVVYPRLPSDSWVRDLFERKGVVLTESPPITGHETDWTWIVGGGGVTWDGTSYEDDLLAWEADESPLEMVRRMIREIEAMPLAPSALILPEPLPPSDDWFGTKDIFITTPPETGRRYGPYDADPHAKGRRRRFRKQRRSS